MSQTKKERQEQLDNFKHKREQITKEFNAATLLDGIILITAKQAGEDAIDVEVTSELSAEGTVAFLGQAIRGILRDQPELGMLAGVIAVSVSD